MRKASYLLASLMALSSTAFAVDNKTVAGAVVGGVAGAVIGNEVGGEKGAVIGAAIGGVAGAAIANKKNESTATQQVRSRVAPVPATQAVVVAQPVVVQAKPESGHDGQLHVHRDRGNHYGQRKHHKHKGKHDRD